MMNIPGQGLLLINNSVMWDSLLLFGFMGYLRSNIFQKMVSLAWADRPVKGYGFQYRKGGFFLPILGHYRFISKINLIHYSNWRQMS